MRLRWRMKISMFFGSGLNFCFDCFEDCGGIFCTKKSEILVEGRAHHKITFKDYRFFFVEI